MEKINNFILWLFYRYSTIFPYIGNFSLLFLSFYYTGNLKQYCPAPFSNYIKLLEPYWTIFFVVSICLIITNYFINKNKFPSQKQLNNKLSKLEKEINLFNEKEKIFSNNIRELFNGLLFPILNQICNEHISKNDMLQKQNCIRINLYYSKNKKFYLLGRVCKNPCLSSIGRPFFKDNEGVIGQGWQEGWKFIEYSQSGKKLLAAYSKDGIGNPNLIKMKSVQYAALRLSSNTNNHHNAILVVESTERKLLQEDKVKQILLEKRQFLYETIECLQNYIPILLEKEQ